VLNLLDRAAALRTLLDRPIREFLDLLEFVFALLTLVFVKRHAKIPSEMEVFVLRF
jgi:hypothetical protein